MISQQLIAYIESRRSLGASDKKIRHTLLTKGLSEADIDAVLGTENRAKTKTINPTVLVQYREKLRWIIFFSIIALDILLIIGIKIMFGTYGIFGVSFISIWLRAVVIFGLATISARKASPKETLSQTIKHSIFRVLNTVLLTAVIVGMIFGTFFFFALNSLAS